MLLLIIIKTYTTINNSGIIAIRLIPFISMASYIKNIKFNAVFTENEPAHVKNKHLKR